MEIRLLGGVELWIGQRRIDLGPPKIRLLLAVLLLEAGRTVPFDTLVRRVWDEDVPARVAVSVQANLSRLRRRLEETGDPGVRLQHMPAVGYRLVVPPGTVDALEFIRVLSQGHAAAAAGQREQAIELLCAGEAMMRGEPLSGLPGSWAQAARAGLEERHHTATLTRIGLQLEQSHPGALVSELRELAGHHPRDEAVAALLMRALHGSGRTGDALDVFTALRQRLDDELGLEPHQAIKQVHRLILRDELNAGSIQRPVATVATVTPVAPPATASAVDTLERDPPGFVGRRHDLDTLWSQILPQLEAEQSVLCVIDGMAGVGKTTLALHLAHRLRARCPGGVLQLHLRGHDPHQGPTTAETALRLLLTMLHVDRKELQRSASLDHAIALWREHTAERRMLILLDDAIDAEQVIPLMPSVPGSVVLVTSRHQLAELPDTVRHTLSLMEDGDAQALFTTAARTSDTTDADALNAIVAACGHLPLALAVAGGLLRTRPSWSAADLAEHLTRSQASRQSDTLTARLNTTFDTSYRDLPELARRVLRRLPLHPGPRIGVHAAAALADVELSAAEQALDVLVEHHLLTELIRHEYRVHDLIRAFAAHVLERDDGPEDRQQAVDRLVRSTLAIVDRATARFHSHRHVNLAADGLPESPISFDTAQSATRWLDAEQESLRALAQQWWRSNTHAREAAALAHLLAKFFDRRNFWKESIPLYENALDTWSRRNDITGQAYALTDLSTVCWRLGALDQAHFYGQTALRLWRKAGDKAGEAEILLQMGRVHRYEHRPTSAIRCYRRSATLRKTLGDHRGRAVSLYHQGLVEFDTGAHSAGVAHTQEALELARAIGDEAMERNCLNNLGEFLRHRGNHSEATSYYEQTMEIAQRLGDPFNIAVAALNLGEIHVLAGDPTTALSHLKPALKIFMRLGDKPSYIDVLLSLARANKTLRHDDEAAALLQEADDIATSLADPLVLAGVELTRGALARQAGNPPGSLDAFRRALEHADQAHVLREQAAAHHGIGDALHVLGDSDSARAHWRQALAIYEPLHAREADELRKQLGELPVSAQ
jgi:DNA-binding SARP family transcriptional activator/tetratricopeptide (TPR) repeat protein